MIRAGFGWFVGGGFVRARFGDRDFGGEHRRGPAFGVRWAEQLEADFPARAFTAHKRRVVVHLAAERHACGGALRQGRRGLGRRAVHPGLVVGFVTFFFDFTRAAEQEELSRGGVVGHRSPEARVQARRCGLTGPFGAVEGPRLVAAVAGAAEVHDFTGGSVVFHRAFQSARRALRGVQLGPGGAVVGPRFVAVAAVGDSAEQDQLFGGGVIRHRRRDPRGWALGRALPGPGGPVPYPGFVAFAQFLLAAEQHDLCGRGVIRHRGGVQRGRALRGVLFGPGGPVVCPSEAAPTAAHDPVGDDDLFARGVVRHSRGIQLGRALRGALFGPDAAVIDPRCGAAASFSAGEHDLAGRRVIGRLGVVAWRRGFREALQRPFRRWCHRERSRGQQDSHREAEGQCEVGALHGFPSSVETQQHREASTEQAAILNGTASLAGFRRRSDQPSASVQFQQPAATPASTGSRKVAASV